MANYRSRKYTNLLLQMIEDGLLDRDTVIMACVTYMSEWDVEDMMHRNEFLVDEETEDDEMLDALDEVFDI